MTDGRVHTAAARAGADVHLITNWMTDTPIADIEEAIKAAARQAIRDARERTQAHQ